MVSEREDPFGGSGKLEPSEHLDPPDTDCSFRTIEQGLDVLASMDILHGNGPGGGPPEYAPEGEDEDNEVATGESVSGTVIVLLASVAISLLLLALHGASLPLLKQLS